MQSLRLLAGIVCAAALVAMPAQPAHAHHCFADEFDINAPVTIKGKLAHVSWVNPHALLQVTGAEAGKAAKDWVFWAATPNNLLRMGVNKAMLADGIDITIEGYAAKDKSCEASSKTGMSKACLGDVRVATLADGRKLYISSGGDGGPRVEPLPPGAKADAPVCTWKNY